ncbi:protein-glutamate methylesterase/protein-glutamine glutaminase [Falsihalocynthiibacter arcticus]|uniref:Protein-glutamate methylesterase/protein-glutamine glutaminase n=1 Tax=Falsihalocynthiibacter arcticus TaxID=1579316 RepID=A0A126V2X3_9RHOB|nr:chemotaxis response regulator protein-glutamate methylesterase [Falsihalocynthiibacter arcticus]AML52681.1 hypothetical protein RC74_16675 [Falsihalocynthiibacter arcticus]
MNISLPKYRVLIVDDSAFFRKAIEMILSKDRRLEVVGCAKDAFEAKQMVDSLQPDVITLDVEMPKMDGLEFLRRLMAHRPIPVVMCSTIVTKGSDLLMQALEMGAVGVIEKGLVGNGRHAADLQMQICDTVRGAALAKLQIRSLNIAQSPSIIKSYALDPIEVKRVENSLSVLGIGSSTGGPEALKTLLGGMPSNCPPIVIVQHMPEVFTGPFAKRLNKYAPMDVREAKQGDVLRNGLALLAPGSHHMEIMYNPVNSKEMIVSLNEGGLVSRHRPSVDVLFRSLATNIGKRATGVILTGMGQDGADGLLEMRQTGSRTYGQDQESCVVYGMPKVAKSIGAVERELPLTSLAKAVLTQAAP